MGITIKAKQTKQNVGKYKGNYRYTFSVEPVGKISLENVIDETALRTGINKCIIHAICMELSDVIAHFASEGFSVPLLYLGMLHFSVRAESVKEIDDITPSLITNRRISMTPNKQIKKRLNSSPLCITCYDKSGVIVRRIITNSQTLTNN